MPLRFIDTEFFKHPYVRGLKGPYKSLYIFIFCDCENSGIWSPDFEIASLFIDQKVDVSGAKKTFDGKFIELENGKWFFPDFIQWQYPNGIQENNPAHKKIIKTLFQFNLIDSEFKIITPLKDLQSPLQGSKVKDMVEGKVEGKGKVKEGDKVEGKESDPVDAKLIHPLQAWISETLPNVSKLKKQLTYHEAETLVSMYPKKEIQDVLESMENYQPLQKKYISVNLTVHKWIKKRISNAGTSKIKAASDANADQLRRVIEGTL